jgi:hypothetical protein
VRSCLEERSLRLGVVLTSSSDALQDLTREFKFKFNHVLHAGVL